MPEDTPPTPLEESLATTGRRFWKMRTVNYTAFGAALNAGRGFPNANGDTVRALHAAASMPVATDASGHVLVNLAAHFVAGDEPLENNPHVTELTGAEYAALLPAPAPDQP